MVGKVLKDVSGNIREISPEDAHVASVKAETAGIVNKQISTLTGMLENYFMKYLSEFADWASFAVDLENREGESQITRRLQFPYSNQAQLYWQLLYGNRTAEELEKNEGADRRTVRFSAIENMRYWEGEWEKIRDEEEGMFGPSFKKANTMVRLEEARLNYNMIKAGYELYAEMYGFITGKAFTYTPFGEAKAAVETPSQNNQRLAMKLAAARKTD